MEFDVEALASDEDIYTTNKKGTNNPDVPAPRRNAPRNLKKSNDEMSDEISSELEDSLTDSMDAIR